MDPFSSFLFIWISGSSSSCYSFTQLALLSTFSPRFLELRNTERESRSKKGGFPMLYIFKTKRKRPTSSPSICLISPPLYLCQATCPRSHVHFVSLLIDSFAYNPARRRHSYPDTTHSIFTIGTPLDRNLSAYTPLPVIQRVRRGLSQSNRDAITSR
ncbi:hypothetical protein HD806DRAFT_474649 [Xylariaceae sp. AK1471]|nr:hypothetical protein HD806DRAFT_474649 [Xylariaceae sp. AK1471]